MRYLFNSDGSPEPGGWIIALFIMTAVVYGINSALYQPLDEIVYMDFLNKYLLTNQIKEINITKDRRSEVFNHRAEIETLDGKKFYMVLGSQESFLAKLDMV